MKELPGNSSGKLFSCGGRGWRKRDSQAKRAILDELRRTKEEVERKVKDLQASKACSESMFNAIADPIIVLDVDSRMRKQSRPSSG